MSDSEFIECITSGKADAARRAMQTDPTLAVVQDDRGVSVLMLALYYDRQEIARNILTHRGELDLWEASALGDEGEVTILVSADLTLVDRFSPDGFTALSLAAFFGQKSVVKILLTNGADVNLPSRNQMNVRPIHSAAAHRDPETGLAILKTLLSYGAEVNVSQQEGWTPLHQAAAHGSRSMVRLLLQYGADSSAKNKDGKTARDIARDPGHIEVERLLPPS